MNIEPFKPGDLEAVVQLSLRAWEPVFESLSAAMDPAVFAHLHPDWRKTQSAAVSSVCLDVGNSIWLAREQDQVLGFIALRENVDSQLGEICMVAVDPHCQRRGIGKSLVQFGVSMLRQAGMQVVMVETGGDLGHEPARFLYRQVGFKALHVERFFMKVK